MFSPGFQTFLGSLYVPFLNLNFVDIAIIAVIIIYAIEGYAVGFLRGLTDFISFVISFFFALSFYSVFGAFLTNVFNIPQGFSNAIGFFIAALISEICISVVLRSILLPLVSGKLDKHSVYKEGEKVAGIVPGVLSAIVLLAFILTLIVALPISYYLKNSVLKSRLGSPLVSSIQGFDTELNNVFGGAVNEALTFLTVEPNTEDVLMLDFQTSETSIDPEAEDEMLILINRERRKMGVKEVKSDPNLKIVAREHCTDMFARGYFSHYTPERKSPFDRMEAGNIDFGYAGENLALAPSTTLAMKGLMNSPGHRENILSKNFGKVGVGAVNGGVYGKMYCQEFTD